jgi:hypothetical protein
MLLVQLDSDHAARLVAMRCPSVERSGEAVAHVTRVVVRAVPLAADTRTALLGFSGAATIVRPTAG